MKLLSTTSQAKSNQPVASSVAGPIVSASFLVTVTHPSGAVDTFRFLTLRKANSCARDFVFAKTNVRKVLGYMTFDRWVEVA